MASIEFQELGFQLFFLAAGIFGGIRLVDDLKEWREARSSKGALVD
jgi:hypothetical protein